MRAAQTPLLDLLKSVPVDGRDFYEVSPIEHCNIPYGRLCNDAADEIEQLRQQLAVMTKDAERYRWLRDNPFFQIEYTGNLTLDEHIDAAMKSK